MSEIVLRVIMTEDGSPSLYRDDLSESYHSFKGAEGESKHVFIKNGFLSIYKSFREIHILEVGFGTGLNALLTALEAKRRDITIKYTALETHPLPASIWQQLSYGDRLQGQEIFEKLHSTDWGGQFEIFTGFRLTKWQKRLEDFTAKGVYHVIYFDAFAPSKQPEIWSIENLKLCYEMLVKGGVLVTYCAQGQFKRNLASVGFIVETLPGAMGKKEMVRAVKSSV